MSTLTATAVPGLAAVRLEGADLPAGPVTIARQDVNGTGQVRLLPGQEPTAGTLLVVDYEAALTGPVTYTLDDATATVELNIRAAVLAVAGRPNVRATIVAVTDYAENTVSPSNVVTVLDREDALVLEAPHYLPTGSLTVWCASYSDAVTVAAVARAGRKVMFRQPDYPGMDRYVTFSASGITPRLDSTAQRRWTVRLDWRETPTPTTDLLAAAGWTFDAVTASFATFDELTAAFPTFNALTVGP